MATFAEALDRARQLLTVGDFASAEVLYRRLLDADRESADAWHELGIVYLQSGRPAEAVECLRQAVQRGPQNPTYHVNLAVAYRQLKQTDEALAVFEQAARLAPPTAELLNNLALARKDAGHLDAALLSFDQALRLRGDYANGYFNRGNLLMQMRRFADAAASYRRAVQLAADDPFALCQLGIACCEQMRTEQEAIANDPRQAPDLTARQKQLSEAAASFRRALELKPDYAEAYSNLAIALIAERRLTEAEAALRRALELSPGAEAHSNLGAVLEKQGRHDEAAACWRQAIALEPDFPDPYNYLASVLSQQGRFEDAVDLWQKALELKPDFPDATGSLGGLLNQLGRIDEARGWYQRALELHPEERAWKLHMASLCPAVFGSNDEIDRFRRDLLAELKSLHHERQAFDLVALVRSCTPSFNLQFHGRDDRPLREAYARLVSDRVPQETPPGATGKPRIGMVVTDQHETLFIKSLAGVLERIDPARFEIVVIGSDRGLGTLQAGIRGPAVRMISSRVTPGEFVATIRGAQLDVAYYWEVGTDGLNYMLPFFRLAPVQCTSWGIQMTTGIPQVDYYISNELVEPADAQSHYSEKLLLTRTLLTYQERLAPPTELSPRESFGLSNEQHIYLCAQQLGKIHPDFDPILADILRRDAAGVVVLTHDRRGTFMTDELRRRFAITMPDVAQRVIFVPFQTPPTYRSLILAADVLLDPLHFGGVNSTYDGLSFNQPIVTLPSRFQRGRYTLGCYQKMGLLDCVADDARQYADIALRLATDRAHRASVVEKIRMSSDILFRDDEAVREHERIFSMLVEQARHSRGRV